MPKLKDPAKRQAFIQDLINNRGQEGLLTRKCEEYGISRSTAYRWIEEEAGGDTTRILGTSRKMSDHVLFDRIRQFGVKEGCKLCNISVSGYKKRVEKAKATGRPYPINPRP
jgi:hypothetical protein